MKVEFEHDVYGGVPDVQNGFPKLCAFLKRDVAPMCVKQPHKTSKGQLTRIHARYTEKYLVFSVP